MEVTQTLSEGLKRAFKVVMPAQELLSRLDEQLAEMREKVRINGFRPGKVPTAHLKRVYGRSVMTDIVQNAVTEANKKIVADNSLRFALEPRIDLPVDRDELEKVLDAKGDLAFTISGEILPQIQPGTFEDLRLERPVAEVPDAEVEATLQRLAVQQRSYAPKTDADATAATDDQVTIDFTGTIDGTTFEGGSGTDVAVVLGSGSFVPGFEEQLVGAKAGESRTVEVTFPTDYSVAELAGKAARFAVEVKEIAAPDARSLDDEFAKGFGADSLDALKGMIRSNLEGEFARASRTKLKRRLLDALDHRYDFVLPESLVEQEFESIWSQVEAERKRSDSASEIGLTEESLRADYHKIAERRVRLGLVLAEVGEKSAVTVTQEEVRAGLVERVRQFPGQEELIWNYYQKNPQMLAEIRAPLYEEKVVDLIIGSATVVDAPVSREELFATDDELPFAGAPEASADYAVAQQLEHASAEPAAAHDATAVTDASEAAAAGNEPMPHAHE